MSGVARVLGVTLLAQAIAWSVLVWAHAVQRIGYGLFDLSDTKLYFAYADKIAHGLRPFFDFRVEYPPLAIPLFRLPMTGQGLHAYQVGFALGMAALTVLAAIVTVFAEYARNGDTHRAYRVAVAFAVLQIATGGIIVNRYDASVALVFAVTLLAIAMSWWEVSGVALGIGFALKLTPLFLLPLPLILAPRRRAVWSALAFATAAVAPFVPYLLGGASSVSALGATFRYHMQRPLEIESVLATPLWVAHRLAGLPLRVEYTFGSHNVVAPGAVLAAASSTPLVLALLALVYWVVARRREALLASTHHVALAMLVTLLGSMIFSKVLSPQYVVWLLPAAALVSADDLPLGVLIAITMALTQWLFPPAYTSLKLDQALGFWVLLARNVVLVTAFVVSARALLRLPETR